MMIMIVMIMIAMLLQPGIMKMMIMNMISNDIQSSARYNDDGKSLPDSQERSQVHWPGQCC